MKENIKTIMESWIPPNAYELHCWRTNLGAEVRAWDYVFRDSKVERVYKNGNLTGIFEVTATRRYIVDDSHIEPYDSCPTICEVVYKWRYYYNVFQLQDIIKTIHWLQQKDNIEEWTKKLTLANIPTYVLCNGRILLNLTEANRFYRNFSQSLPNLQKDLQDNSYRVSNHVSISGRLD